MFGALRFFEAGRAAGIKPIIGVEAYVAPGSRFERNPGENEEKYHHLTLLAENETGYRNLLKLVIGRLPGGLLPPAAHGQGAARRARRGRDLPVGMPVERAVDAAARRAGPPRAGGGGTLPRHLRSRSLLHGAAGSRHPGPAAGAPEAGRARAGARHPARRDERPPLHGAERREAARRAALHPAAEAPERPEAAEVRLGRVLPEERRRRCGASSTSSPEACDNTLRDRRARRARPGVRGPGTGGPAVPPAAVRDAGSQGPRRVPARARVPGRARSVRRRSRTTSAAGSTTSWTSSRRWGSRATS